MNYSPLTSAAGRGVCINSPQLRQWLTKTNLLEWFCQLPEAQKHGARKNSCVTEIPLRHKMLPLFCKHYSADRLKGRLQALLNLHRARRVFHLTRELYQQGINTPRPLGYWIGAKSHQGSFLLTEILNDCVDLRLFSRSETAANKLIHQCIALKSVTLMANLHQQGVAHGDFKLANLLWSEHDHKIYLIDFDGARRINPLKAQQSMARDLARFLLGCYEAGVTEKELSTLENHYFNLRKMDNNAFRQKVSENFEKLLIRHKKKSAAVKNT